MTEPDTKAIRAQMEAQGADPVAWQIKPLAFDWQPKDRDKPCLVYESEVQK